LRLQRGDDGAEEVGVVARRDAEDVAGAQDDFERRIGYDAQGDETRSGAGVAWERRRGGVARGGAGVG
jgi:hypothetical protein